MDLKETKDESVENKNEQQYLNLIRDVLDHGTWEVGRNGRTKEIFGYMMRFSLSDGRIPFVTTKRLAWKTCLKELLWFISGNMDGRNLEAMGVNIWKDNGSRQFLDSRGLQRYPVGVLGPCFLAETPVLTINGYKNIENIQVGEFVYTHLGNRHPVSLNISRSYSGTIVHINPNYICGIISTTPEHPFYAREYYVKSRHKINGIEKRNVVFSSNPTFIPACNLIKGKHMIGMKIVDEEIIPTFKNVHGLTLNIDNPDFYWMMGLFVGDGWLVNDNGYNRINFAIADTQVNTYIPQLHKVLPNLAFKRQDQGCSIWRCNNIDVSKILSMFGKYAHGKLIPEFLHQAPKHLINAFLLGYVAADGCYRYDGRSTRITTVSRDLALGCQKLYAKLGFVASLSYDPRIDKVSIFNNREYPNVYKQIHQLEYFQYFYNH